MPAFIAAAVLPLVVSSPIWVLGPAAVSAVAAGIGYAAVVGVGLLAQRLGRQEAPKPEDVQGNYKQPTPTRTALYGQGKLGGPYLFRETNRGTLLQVIALASRCLDSIQEYWCDDNLVTPNAGGVVTQSPYDHDLDVVARLGLPTETAFGELINRFPGKWTAAHRGDGIATLMTVLDTPGEDEVMEVFPNGANTLFRVVARGCRIYDPTDIGQNVDNAATWTWSDNLARIVMDYLRDRDGMRVPLSMLATPQALAGWRQAVADCNDMIPLKAGGTERRYRAWGSYSFSERPGDVLRRFMAAGNARLAPTPDGGMHLEVGKWRAPTVSIDETAITGFQGLGRGKSILETANTITAQFTSVAHDYQATEADPWVDDEDVADRGEIATQADLVCSPSHAQTRRLMKIEAARANPEWVGTFACNLQALAAFGERFIHVRYQAFGIDHDFEVMDFQFVFGEHATLIGVTLQLQSIGADAYAWNPTVEEGTAPAVDKTDDDHVIPLVIDLAAMVIRKSVGGTQAPFARLSWVPYPNTKSLQVELRGKKTSESAWQSIPVATNAVTADSFLLDDGAQYEFQARHRAASGRLGTWTPSVEIVAVADTVAPAALLSFSATGGTGQVAVGFGSTNDAHLSRVAIYLAPAGTPLNRTTHLSTRPAVAPGISYSVPVTAAVGTYDVYAEPLNPSGIAGPLAGPVSATVT